MVPHFSKYRYCMNAFKLCTSSGCHCNEFIKMMMYAWNIMSVVFFLFSVMCVS